MKRNFKDLVINFYVIISSSIKVLQLRKIDFKKLQYLEHYNKLFFSGISSDNVF